jgi:hypothetical protein
MLRKMVVIVKSSKKKVSQHNVMLRMWPKIKRIIQCYVKNYCNPSPCPPSPAYLLAFSATKYNVTQQQPNNTMKNTSATLKLMNSNIAMPKSMLATTK